MGASNNWMWLALLAACSPNERAPEVPDPPTVATASAPKSDVGPILMTLRGWQMSKDMRAKGPLAIGDTLESGDYFSYYVRVDRAAYVSVLQFFADGSAKVLFPEAGPEGGPEGGEVRLLANQETRVPTDPGQWFQLDDAPGTEHVYVIASAMPLTQAAPALAQLVGEVRTSPSAMSDGGRPAPTDDSAHGFSERDIAPPEPSPSAAPQAHSLPKPAPAVPSPLEHRYQAHFRGVELVRIDGQVAYEGRTDQDGVGVAHFSFRHD